MPQYSDVTITNKLTVTGTTDLREARVGDETNNVPSNLSVTGTLCVGMPAQGLPGKLCLYGDLELSGAVDGRDVSADGCRLDDHLDDTANPHGTTAAQVGALVSLEGVGNPGGNIDLAPAGALTVTPDAVNHRITLGETHSSRTNNPHGTTAAQVGALPLSGGTLNGPLTVTGDIRIGPRQSLWLMNDDNHGAGYYGIKARGDRTFAGADIDGPVVFGWNGGALGSKGGGERIALTWHQNQNISIGGTIVQDGWTRLALRNNWVVYGLPWNPEPGFFRDKNGIVHLRGLVKGGLVDGGPLIENFPIAVLPDGYRPQYREMYIVCTGGPDTAGRCDIDTDGRIVPVSGRNGWFSLDGITFRANGF
jgi:hypothetical protein